MIESKIVDGLNHNVRHAGALTELQRLHPAAIIFLGPPGAGKGTQAQQVAQEYSLPHISTGEVFRSHVANKTALGLKAAEAMRRGMLVDDNVVCGMLAEHIHNLDYTGSLVLDGFPRSMPQAKWLSQFLQARTSGSHDFRRTAPLAIHINVSRDQLIRRLSGRRSCPTCGQVYNLHFQPPRKLGICDYDGAKLSIRQDDCENVVVERLIVHDQNTLPVTEYYRRKGQLREINGNDTVEKVRTSVADVTRMLNL